MSAISAKRSSITQMMSKICSVTLLVTGAKFYEQNYTENQCQPVTTNLALNIPFFFSLNTHFVPIPFLFGGKLFIPLFFQTPFFIICRYSRQITSLHFALLAGFLWCHASWHEVGASSPSSIFSGTKKQN